MIKFKFKNAPQTIQDRIEDVFDEAQQDFKNRLENAYGEQYINSKMFKTGKVFENKTSVYTGRGSVDKEQLSEIGKHYERAWREKYQELQERHKQLTPAPVDPQGETPHIKRKKVTQGEPAPHNTSTVGQYVEGNDSPWTLWTGLFRKKVGDAFTSDFSNEYVEITNLLLAGGFRMLGGGFPHLYDKFTKWFRSNGIVRQNMPFQMSSDGKDFRGKVADEMAFYAERRIAEPFIEIFNNLNVKV
jgi:hypothetical protein